MKISIVLLVLGVFCAVSSSVSSSAPSWLENYYRNSVQQASNRKYPNSYYYNYNRYGGSPPRLGGRGRGPSAYAAMSDIDWSKRSGYYQDNWILPEYGYGSMADTDWGGWKKRSAIENKVNDEPVDDDDDDDKEEGEDGDDDDDDDEAAPMDIATWWKNYRSSMQPPQIEEPIAIASRQSGYSGYSAAPRKYYSWRRPSSRLTAPRKYAFHSMADIDWGKRKRSMWGYDKRHFGSLARGAGFAHYAHNQ